MTPIIPDWPAPASVKAVSTTRVGGFSLPPYTGLNLGMHVGDNADLVTKNRKQLQKSLGLVSSPAWLNQIHSTKVIELESALASPVDADGAITLQPGLACTVMTADCLPVLLCDKEGTQVAAVHAGWRGLAGGIIDNAVEKFTAPASNLLAWLGPAIGPKAFEVGGEVREQFIAANAQATAAFVPHHDKWLADLYLLATQNLHRLGVTQVYGGGHCTFSDPEQFYSYRRESVTGRQASLIWLDT